MSLDLNKLENVRELAGGIVQARCPACSEGGHDRTGVHLRIFPDGKFGCCVAAKDSEHRKRIFALVGMKQPGNFTLRIKTPPAVTAGQSVKASLANFNSGTLGTPKTESENSVPNVPSSKIDNLGTLGTGLFKSRAYARGELPMVGEGFQEQLKDLESGVPSVPECLEPVPTRIPFLRVDGTLCIPFDSPERYHWWKGGRSIAETRRELEVAVEQKDRHG